jgi:hypothetical protein
VCKCNCKQILKSGSRISSSGSKRDFHSVGGLCTRLLKLYAGVVWMEGVLYSV